MSLRGASVRTSESAAKAADFKIEGTFSDRLDRGPYPILARWTPPPSPVQAELEPKPESAAVVEELAGSDRDAVPE